MKAVYVVLCGESRVCSFEEKAHAYQAKSKLQSDKDCHIHVDKQVVFESMDEWQTV